MIHSHSALNRTATQSEQDSWIGLLVALGIFAAWLTSLAYLLGVSLAMTPAIESLLAVGFRTFLHTGLFILAHDAMHGSLFPPSRVINQWIGRFALGCYGFLSYERCLSHHWHHHRYTGLSQDPDGHHGMAHNPLLWYCKFISAYLPVPALILLLTILGVIAYGFHRWLGVSIINFFLFCILPLILSSLQLFLFGTYFPHRNQDADPGNVHPVQSSNLPFLWSFLACYHFSYHWEHHEYPMIPWYRLPYIKSCSRS
jgi:beta-carotene ketolase (CrtW type)